MKKVLCLVLVALVCMSALLVGCTDNSGDRPDSYSGIRWISPDYRIRFTPDDGCKGSYYSGETEETKDNLRFEFDGSTVTAYCTDKNDARFFWADWSYEENGRLAFYHISFNTDEFKEMKNDKTEFITLKQEPLETEAEKK